MRWTSIQRIDKAKEEFAGEVIFLDPLWADVCALDAGPEKNRALIRLAAAALAWVEDDEGDGTTDGTT